MPISKNNMTPVKVEKYRDNMHNDFRHVHLSLQHTCVRYLKSLYLVANCKLSFVLYLYVLIGRLSVVFN